jgi:LPXTG-motif cell wall-anchored protein
MRSRLSRLRAPLAAVAAIALVGLGPGTAFAANEPDPVHDFVGGLQQQVEPQQAEPQQAQQEQAEAPAAGGAESTDANLATPSSPAPAPSSDDDLPGHETEDPTPPDHGEAQLADVNIGDEDVVDASHNNSTVEDDDSTTADSTLLALGGQEILGAHADSEGQNEEHFGDPLAPLCEGSEGQVCLQVLYADAWATDDGTTSSSRSQSGVLGACLGGTSSDPAAECDGPVAAGVAESDGTAQRIQGSGRTTASSESDLVDICLERDPATSACALGIGVLHSEGQSDSNQATGTASRDSYVLGLDLGGESVARLEDPTSLALQPECADPSLICVFANQGETYLGGSVAGHAQEALNIGVLADTLGLQIELGRSDSLVHNDGGEVAPGAGGGNAPGTDIAGAGGGAGGPGQPGTDIAGVSADAGGGVLPNTGGIWSGLLAVALFAVAAGAFVMAYSRRRVGALV